MDKLKDKKQLNSSINLLVSALKSIGIKKSSDFLEKELHNLFDYKEDSI